MDGRPALPGRVLVVGLGLIGASLAAALRRARFASVIAGFDSDPAAVDMALELGLIDAGETSLHEALAASSLVVLAVPSLAVEGLLPAVRDHAPPDVVITDVASVKGGVVASAGRVFGGVPQRLVPGHPIAGSERSGTQAADAGLFRDHRVILCPDSGTDAVALAQVQSMWACAGADVVCMDVESHDRVLALTSHLPHALAFTLVDALAREDASEQIFRFAAGGFRDFTRIASSDPVMWRDIAVANREALLGAIDLYAERLAELRSLVEAGDAQGLESLFRRAREARGRNLHWLGRAANVPAIGGASS
jgi:prephenate dehydrogenase